MAGKELAQQVDPDEEPSVEWGWHGGFPKTSLIAGWVSTAIMLVFLIGNHQGRTEDLWLIGVAIVMAAGLVMHTIRQRNAWRR
ncbi:MAG: DUF2631 domain-containing protein [Pseudonocardia sp.]|nr:DUF2631 domain-containing protein [Pseudonocardia sp.]